MYLPGAVKAGDVVQGAGGSDLWDIIWRGSMPRLADDSVDWDYYYSNYFRTYIERDVRELVNVRDEEKFSRFVVACAARTGELVNYSDLAADCSIDTKTARHWISVLQASGIVKLLLPFFSNASKRLSKTPKLYFMDTGLACHLLGWTSPLTLRNGAASGQMFETFVVGEILKSYFNDGRTADNVFFYRDSKKREIDVLIRDGRTLRPVEIKQNVRPGREAIKNFSALESISGFDIGQGAVICQTDATYWIGENVMAESVWMI